MWHTLHLGLHYTCGGSHFGEIRNCKCFSVIYWLLLFLIIGKCWIHYHGISGHVSPFESRRRNLRLQKHGTNHVFFKPFILLPIFSFSPSSSPFLLLLSCRHWIRVIIVLVVVMGMAWIANILFFDVNLLFIAYIMTIFIAGQGIIIFILFVPLSEQV